MREHPRQRRPDLSLTFGEHDQVHRAAVKRDKTGRFVEPEGRGIAHIHG